ncbi:MAG: hypothetical protein HY909_22350 [Deltaproteobacteria bacterium]|nr:hypothetical protein [Deltaproteobacteria bacterium]
MAACRLFLSHEALESWMTEGRVEVVDDVLTDNTTGQRFQLTEGVRFLAEVTGAEDAPGLVGKVKDLAQLAELQGECQHDSVILGDNAYQVQPGFVGVPDAPQEAPPVEGEKKQAIAALQAFFLNNVK